MEFLLLALTKELDFFLEHNVRVRVVGRLEGLSKRIQEAIDSAEQRTAGGTRGQINLCLNYGGRAEIIEGVKKLIREGRVPESIDETRVSESLWTAGIP